MARRDLEDRLLRFALDIDRLSREGSTDSLKLARQSEWSPRIDVIESQDAVVIRAEIAGVRARDVSLQINAEEKTLTLRGVRPDERCYNGRARIHQLEIECGPFAREVILPDVEYEFEEIQTHLRQGLLLVILPIRTEASSAVVIERTITIEKF